MNIIKFVSTILLLITNSVIMAKDSEWQAVIGDENLRKFMSGRTLAWEEIGGEKSRGEYREDGTGVLYAWGTSFPRNWEIKGDEQICVSGDPASDCYKLEKHSTDPKRYRTIEAETGTVAEIRITDDQGGAVLVGAPKAGISKGGPAKPSANEMATKLLNPSNPIMKIGNHFEYQQYDGNLPGAGDQTSFKYKFQSVFPFKFSNGNSLLVRPSIPLLIDQPVPSSSGGFESVGTEIGDIGMDVIYSGTTKTGTIWGLGAIMTIPTATDDRIAKDLWNIGPEVLFGKAGKWGAIGGVLGHQRDVAGSGNGSTNLTTLNYFYGLSLDKGWALTATPVISYNHEASSGNELNLPLGIGISKTTTLGGRPWQFIVQYWNHVERSDVFAPKHTIRLTISPVISAPWNKGK